MNPRSSRRPIQERWLDVQEIRLIGDLRIVHAKVNELYYLVQSLRQRHGDADIVEYSDRQLLGENIAHVDEIYLWYVKLKEETERRNGELD
jgi:hypothetical protein